MGKIANLQVKNFRAIKDADIQINGITVVSGVNGSGKSTLSKLLYYALKNANSFEDLVIQHINIKLRPYFNVLDQLSSLYYIFSHQNLSRNALRHNKRGYRIEFVLSDLDSGKNLMDDVRELCDRFIELENSMNNNGKSSISNRLYIILRSTLQDNDPNHDTKYLLDKLIQKINEHIQKAELMVAERPYKFLKDSIEAVFDEKISKKISLQEYDDYILGDDVLNVPLLHYFKKVVYIDTPMVIGMETYPGQPSYWKELNNLIRIPPKRGYKRSINNFIKENIIKGDTSFDTDMFSGGFKYKRIDGKEFDLLECATGIKSFSLLQMLLKNLYLDDNTLMIIDEPEAHLHPQWIVEYANLIVMLHKKLGVKFFIASHSTDMVSAIRYISEKEKCLSSVSFYVAEEDSKSSSYSFNMLNNDIEPIFESFNKSFKVLDSYVG